MLTFLTKYKGYVLALVAALVLWVAVAHYVESTRQENQVKAESTLHIAQDSLHLALAGMKAREQVIVTMTTRADSNGKRATAAQVEAGRLKATIPGLRARLDSALLAAADSLSPAYEDATLLFDAMDARADSLDSALTSRAKQVDALTGALDSARTSLRTLARAAITVDTAATRVVTLSHPRWFIKIAPKPGIGVALGFDQTGKPAAVVGFTLSWPR
jgi:hypothetical protein